MKILNEYQNFCVNHAFFTEGDNIDFLTYLTISLSGEVGELSNWIKKIYRDKGGDFDEKDLKHIKGELGDILWYVSVLSHKLGFSLEEVTEYNKEKIKRRFEKGTQRGSGDDR